MTPEQIKSMCTHQPNYMKGCIACNVRYVIFLRPSREKQDKFLSGLPEHARVQTMEILRRERQCS